MTMLNVLRSYESVPRTDVKGRKEWCKARWVNERGLKKAILARDQMRGICEKEGVDWRTTSGDDSEPILRSLLDGLFANTAILRDGEYKQLVGSSVSRRFLLLFDASKQTNADRTRSSSLPVPVLFTDGQDPSFFGSSFKTSSRYHLRRDREFISFFVRPSPRVSQSLTSPCSLSLFSPS